MRLFVRPLMSILVIVLPFFARAEAPQCRYPTEAIEIPDPVPQGELALTFDDGPDPDLTPVVLKILKAHGIHATFFLVGRNVAAHPHLVSRILAEGHMIGNHSLSHEHLPTLKPTEIRRQVLENDKFLRKFPIKNNKYFRFPYGESNCVGEEIVEKAHYNIVGWNIDSCDWSFNDGLPNGDCIEDEATRNRYRNDYLGWLDHQVAEAGGGGVVLMHDVQPFTAQHLESALQHWESQGFKFITLDGGRFPRLNQEGPF